MRKSSVLLLASLAAVSLDAETLENAALRIGFAGPEKGYAIESVVNRLASDVRFVESGGKGASFWEATFWKDGCPGVASNAVKLTNLSPCRAKRMVKSADGGAIFIWEGLDLGDEKAAVTVRATVRFAACGASKWALEVQNHAVGYALAETRYPILRRTMPSGAGDLLQPRADLGARLVRKRTWGRPVGFGCMGYAPMMTAALRDGAGLYFAAHDSSARVKSLQISSELDFSFTTPVEYAGLVGRAAEGPRYEVSVVAFKGDWWEAARLYRAWALTTKWASKGRILDRTDYPRRLAEIPLWLNIHADPDEVSNTMARVRRIFPKVDGGIHWHLWQHSGHDVNYPEYFPEQPGTKACVAFCHSIGEEPMPYTNGRLWSQTLLSFPYAKPFAITRPDGSPVTEKYGPATPPLSPMCPWTPQWDASVNAFGGKALDLGFRSLFLDQIGACAGQACYHPAHGHPIGGGAWYFAGYQRLLERLHRRYAAKDAFLTTEGSGEEWMNVIDGYLTVTQRQPDDVPFFHAVYNGYTTYFCTPENQLDDLDSFWAAQARELLWGQALGWYHPLILNIPEKCALVNRLAEYRQANKEFFAYGTLLGEVAFFDPVPEQPITWLGRKPFWAWKMPDYPLSKTLTGTVPGVVGYLWQSGTTGETRAFLANLTSRDQRVRFRFGASTRELTLRPRDLRCCGENQ